MITIIGLGNREGELTVKGRRAAEKAAVVAVRSVKTDAAKSVADLAPVSMDELYERAEDFDALSRAIADRLLALSAERGSVAYCVDGDGYADTSVAVLLKIAEAEVGEIIAGPAPARAPSTSVTELSAQDLAALPVRPDTLIPLVVYALDNKMIAGEVKLKLLEWYDASAEARFTYRGKTTVIPLEELDRQSRYDYSASVELPGQSFIKKRYTFDDLLRVMARLTAPDGCPWDKAQTHESIRINLLEESYEAVDAIDSGNLADMIEELGDVMLQAVFHCNIAERTGEFTLGDVMTGLCEKLVTRHTHIFGENKADDPDEALGFWEKAKAVEKSYTSVSDQLDRLPQNFPATLRVEKALKKIKKAEPIITAEQCRAELTRLAAADVNKAEASRILFLATALSYLCGLDAEVALNEEAKKLIEDFKRRDHDAK